jgi:hypothetical protein
MPGIRVNREAILNFDQFSTQGSLISRALGIAGFAFRKPGQRIVHGIKTLQRSAQPSTTIPALESIIALTARRTIAPAPIANTKCCIRITSSFLFRAFFMPNKTRTAASAFTKCKCRLHDVQC